MLLSLYPGSAICEEAPDSKHFQFSESVLVSAQVSTLLVRPRRGRSAAGPYTYRMPVVKRRRKNIKEISLVSHFK